MSTLNDPQNRASITFYDNGPEAPTMDVVRENVGEGLKDAFGVDLDLSINTPQGQIQNSAAASIFDKNNEILFDLEMHNPEKAEGIYQDNICNLYFIKRKPAIPTIADCVCIGVKFAKVPSGSLVQDTLGRQYKLIDDITFGANGAAVGRFACTTPGPITAAANTINRIVTQIPGGGWDSVNNPNAAVTGNFEESRLALENRRKEILTKNSRGTAEAMYGAIYDIDEVVGANYAENVGGSPTWMKGVIVPEHSIFMSVVGGSEEQIAQAFYSKKDMGCGYAGNTPVRIMVDTNNPDEPVEYNIIINRPRDIAVKILVEIESIPERTPGDIRELTKAQVIAVWYGQYNIPRPRPGHEVLAASFYCALQNLAAPFLLRSVQISRPTPVQTTIARDELLYYDQVFNATLGKPTQVLAQQYPQFFSLTPTQGFVIDDSAAAPSTTYLDYGDKITTRLDENPTLVEADINVVILNEVL